MVYQFHLDIFAKEQAIGGAGDAEVVEVVFTLAALGGVLKRWR